MGKIRDRSRGADDIAKRSQMRRRWAAAIVVAVGLVGIPPMPASADNAVTVKYGPTQRQSDATLSSTLIGTYAKGAKVTLRCHVNGQNVRNSAGTWSKLWYRDGAGWFVPAVDLSANPAKPVSGVGACAANAPGLDGNKWYVITNVASGKALDVRKSSNKNGTAVLQYTTHKGANQQFQFTSTGGRFYRVESALSGSNVWDVSKSSGTKVQIWGWGGQKAGTSNQQWLIVAPTGKTADGVEFRLRADTNKCLDVPNASKANSVQLQVYRCNGTNAQRFRLAAIGASAPYKLPFPKGKRYQITQGPAEHAKGLYPEYNKHAVDFATPVGETVVASAAGKVYFEGWDSTGAIQIKIDHGGNVCSQYTHLSRTVIDKGQQVKQGQKIGLSGNTGISTGPHLHWNIVYCDSGKSRAVPNSVEMGTKYPLGWSAYSQNG